MASQHRCQRQSIRVQRRAGGSGRMRFEWPPVFVSPALVFAIVGAHPVGDGRGTRPQQLF